MQDKGKHIEKSLEWLSKKKGGMYPGSNRIRDTTRVSESGSGHIMGEINGKGPGWMPGEASEASGPCMDGMSLVKSE